MTPPAAVGGPDSRRFLPDAWRAAVDGSVVLVGTRCPSCGVLAFPPEPYCPRCLGSDLGPEDLPAEGTVVASSVVRIAERGIPAPYAVGQVDLGEVAVTGRLADAALGPGHRVRPVVGMIRDDDPPLLGWVFAGTAP